MHPQAAPAEAVVDRDDLARLVSAIEAYTYPCVTVDFERLAERVHRDVRELERRPSI